MAVNARPNPPDSGGWGWAVRPLWLTACVLCFVYLAGVGTGWVVGTRVGERGAGRGARRGMLLDGGPIAAYGLSASQRARVDRVLETRRLQIGAFWEGPGLALRTILDSTRADVRAILTPDQRARFDSAHALHERRRRQRLEQMGERKLADPRGRSGSGPPY